MHVTSRQYERRKTLLSFKVFFCDEFKNNRELSKIKKNCEFSANGVFVEYDTNVVRPDINDEVFFDFDVYGKNYMVQSKVVRKTYNGFALYFESTNWELQNLFKTFY